MIERQVRAFLIVACAGLSASAALSDEVAGVLRLRAGDVATTVLDWKADLDPRRVQIVLVDGPMSGPRHAQIAARGARVIAFVPDAALLVDIGACDEKQRAALRGLAFVRGVTALPDAWKLCPYLRNGVPEFAFQSAERVAAQARGEVIASVLLRPGVTAEAGSKAVLAGLDAAGAGRGVSVLSSETMGDETTLVVRLPAARVPLLASVREVLFAEHAPELLTRSNAITRWVVQSPLVDATPFYDRGLTGIGQILGVVDDPYNPTHCAIFDVQPIGPTHRKLVAYNTTQGAIMHGIHVSTTLAGDDPSDINLRGIAYQAKMAFNGLPAFGEANVYSRFELHRTQGAFVHNNSWGNSSTTSYDSTSRAVDNFLWTNEDNLLVFSVANLSTLRNPENAKNALAVGASRNWPIENEYCAGGAGPTNDGRRKPEVMAPGCSIISGGSAPCATGTMTGTSMATPAVTGLVALLRQYFVEGWYPSGVARSGDARTPSGALLRAMAVASAQDLAVVPGYPSEQEGWGRVQGDSAAYFMGDFRGLVVRDVRRTDAGALDTGESVQHVVGVRASGQPLRVVMAFTDAPGAVLTTQPVVNNLDLRVTGPTGLVYRGNVFVDRQSAAGGVHDALNSIEVVLLNQAPAGQYTIEVLAPAVNLGPQGYALVVTGDIAQEICDGIDFNNDGLFPDDMDVVDFLSVLAGGACSTGACNDIDFNNDGLFPDDGDLVSFFTSLAGGVCP